MGIGKKKETKTKKRKPKQIALSCWHLYGLFIGTLPTIDNNNIRFITFMYPACTECFVSIKTDIGIWIDVVLHRIFSLQLGL